MKKRPYRRLKPRLDPAGEGYPMPMRGLLTLGKPKAEASYTEWADQLREYVPQLIQMVLDPDLNERPEQRQGGLGADTRHGNPRRTRGRGGGRAVSTSWIGMTIGSMNAWSDSFAQSDLRLYPHCKHT